MAYYPDLAACDYFGSGVAETLRAVGWLDADHAVPQGDVSRPWMLELTNALVAPWQPYSFAGSHECELCRFTGGPTTFGLDGVEAPIGVSNLFVPTESVVFVAPSMVLHYIDSHGYAPPLEFQTALENCPEPGTMAFRKLLLRHGLHKLKPSGT